VSNTTNLPERKNSVASSLGNYGTFIGIAASALVVIIIFAVTQLEFYERTRWERPSNEVWSNNFYVIGKWLSKTGHPVRFRPRWTGIENLSPREGGVYLQASLFDWEEGGDLLALVRQGLHLIISVDSPWYWEDESYGEEVSPEPINIPLEKLKTFLETLGVKLWYPSLDNRDAAGNEADEAEEDEPPDAPAYDRGVAFELAEAFSPDTALILRDRGGIIRLIRIPLGAGRITVTGECYFMYNGNLSNEMNSRVAWELTGGSLDAKRPGMLFIRGRRAVEGFFKNLAGRGNLAAPVVSVLVLILVGFWMVIPGFGIPLTEDLKRRGTITGRFRAEARFLSRYGAQRIYLETYLRELRRQNGDRGLGSAAKEIKEVEDALATTKKISPRKMAAYLKNLMSALEQK
jgi:hypothetical protein